MTLPRTVAAAIALSLALAARGRAQRVQPEVRLDVLGPAPASVEPGAGVNVLLGYYARAGLAAGYALGRPVPAGGAARERLRVDAVTRVTLDPFRQQRWGLSLGVGVSVRRGTAYLLALADLEGPAVGGFVPALQAGMSGGLRAGFVVRRAIADRR